MKKKNRLPRKGTEVANFFKALENRTWEQESQIYKLNSACQLFVRVLADQDCEVAIPGKPPMTCLQVPAKKLEEWCGMKEPCWPCQARRCLHKVFGR